MARNVVQDHFVAWPDGGMGSGRVSGVGAPTPLVVPAHLGLWRVQARGRIAPDGWDVDPTPRRRQRAYCAKSTHEKRMVCPVDTVTAHGAATTTTRTRTPQSVPVRALITHRARPGVIDVRRSRTSRLTWQKLRPNSRESVRSSPPIDVRKRTRDSAQSPSADERRLSWASSADRDGASGTVSITVTQADTPASRSRGTYTSSIRLLVAHDQIRSAADDRPDVRVLLRLGLN